MRITRRLATALAAATVVFSFGFTSAHSAEKLIISSWAPPTHGINSKMWPRLIKMIEDATGGAVTAEIKYKLAPPPAQFDLVQDGAADLTWIFHGYSAGRFVATKLIELPGYTGSAEAASVAYWRAQDKFLNKANEHKGVKLIALMTHGPAFLHSNKKVTDLADVSGMKVRVPGGVGSDVGAALGAKGIKVPAPKVYETLASNAADGVVMPFESRKGFKLTEVAKNVYEMPGGFYRGSFALIMNIDKFNSLPEAARKALEEKVFGEPAAKMAGKVWDEIDAEGRKVTEAASDNSINTATDADQAAYGKIAASIREKVIGDASAKGVDAKAAVDFIAKEMKSYDM